MVVTQMESLAIHAALAETDESLVCPSLLLNDDDFHVFCRDHQ